jgi:hypothetical protein
MCAEFLRPVYQSLVGRQSDHRREKLLIRMSQLGRESKAFRSRFRRGDAARSQICLGPPVGDRLRTFQNLARELGVSLGLPHRSRGQTPRAISASMMSRKSPPPKQ